jgi:tetratricopeptide (TPR) repeat protein
MSPNNLANNMVTRSLARTIALTLAFVVGMAATSAAQTGKPGTAAPASPLATAKAQLAKGDFMGADHTLLTLLSSDPNNETALLLLGTLRLQQKRAPEAESLFRRAVQVNPTSVGAHRHLAGVLAASEKYDEALDQYKAALALAPQDPSIHAGLAQLYVSRGDFQNALSALNSIPAAQQPQVAALKAAALLGLNKRTEAEAQIAQAKLSPRIAMDLAETFLAANLPDDALKSLATVSPALKLPPDFYFLKGSAQRANGDFALALQSFQQALAKDPKFLPALLAMAQINAALGKHVQSMEDLQQARKLDPDAVPVLRHLIMEAMQAGREPVAAEAARDLQQKSTDPDDQFLIASVLLEHQDYEDAGKLLEPYAAQHPQNAKAQLGLGMVYYNELRYADARKALDRALELDPKLADAEYYLALTAIKEGQGSDAIPRLERVLSVQPKNAAAWLYLGSQYMEAGNLEKAEPALERASALDPNNTKVEYNLGLVLNKLGRQDEASKHMARYQQLLKAERSGSGGMSPLSK